MVFVGIKDERSHLYRPRGSSRHLEVCTHSINALCFMMFCFLENGMAETSQEEILLQIRQGSQIFMVKDCQMVNILQSIGTGSDGIRRIFKELWIRFLQQWVIAYNGYDGNIYIMTAKTLPNFDTPRIFIPKEDGKPDQKQWYPNIIHKFMGINPQIQCQDDHCILFIARWPAGWQYSSHVLERLS